MLEREYIRVGDKEYDVRRNEDDTYIAVRNWLEASLQLRGVLFPQWVCRGAGDVGDNKLKYEDVFWDDDWHPIDVQLEE